MSANLTFSASTNQITSPNYTYDAAGDLTEDSSNSTAHTYQWDAEGRVSKVDSGNTWTFTYDAVGDRVAWVSGGTTYNHLFDPAGNWLGVAGSYSLVWLGGRQMAVYTSSATAFNHVNNLNSTTMYTNQGGTAVGDQAFYPWGDAWLYWGVDGYNFASLDYYDTSTTTALAPFRVFSPNIGRWHSPDPLGGDVTNPQSLNRYAYVMSNPTTNTDPTGLVTIHGPGNPPGGGGGGCDPDDPSCDPDPCDIDFVFGCPSGDGGGGGQTPHAPSSSGGASQSNNFNLGTKCLSDQVIAQIQIDLLDLFNSTHGANLNRGDMGVTFENHNGTETLVINQPFGTPVTQILADSGTPYDHPGFSSDIRVKGVVPHSPGDYGHDIWNTSSTIPPIISNAEEHSDIGTFSIRHPKDTIRHTFRWGYEFFAPAPAGCVQKFADFGMF